jgi:hypothetical protein
MSRIILSGKQAVIFANNTNETRITGVIIAMARTFRLLKSSPLITSSACIVYAFETFFCRSSWYCQELCVKSMSRPACRV